MAKKSRRKKPSPQKSSFKPGTAPAEGLHESRDESPFRILIIILSVGAFAAAVAGLLFAYAGGDANRYFPLDHGVALVADYRLLLEHGFPLQRAFQNNNLFFPGQGVPLLLSLALGNPFAAIHVYGALVFAAMAAGAFLLARRAAGDGGDNAAAWLAWTLAGVMALSITFAATEELFVTLITYGFRGGLFALSLLAAWLAFCALFAPSVKISLRYAAGLLVALSLLQFSYVIVLVWFTLPLLAAVLLALLIGWIPPASPHWKILIAAIAGAYLLEATFNAPLSAFLFAESYEYQATSASVTLENFLFSLSLFKIWLKHFVTAHFFLFAVWSAFVGLSVNALGRAVFFRLRLGKSGYLQREGSAPAVPALSILAFLLAAVVLPVAAALLTGKFSLWGRVEHFANHRYFLPTIYIPLFAGWPVLFAYYLPFLRRRFAHADRVLTAASAALAVGVIVFSLPHFRYAPQIGALAAYSSPFLECAQAGVNKYNLSSGLTPTDFADVMHQHVRGADGAPLEVFSVSNHRALMEALRQPFDTAAENPFRAEGFVSGGVGAASPERLDFIVANWTDTTKTMQPPETARCPGRLQNPEKCYDYAYADIHRHFIHRRDIVEYYGEPEDIFRCEGLDFYIYDDIPFERR